MKIKKTTTATGLTFLMLLLLLLTKTGCRKADNENKVVIDNLIVEKFFRNSSTVDPIVQKVVTELKKNKQNNGLIEKLVKNNGYAIWEKSFSKIKKDKNIFGRTTSSANDTIVIIPFAQENTSTVSAYIEAHISDSLRMSLYQSNQYKNYSNGVLNSSVNNAEKFAYEFMLLEKKVFNHTKFKILDSNLFKNAFSLNNVASNQFRYLKINITSTTSNRTPDDDGDAQQNPCVEIWYDPDGDDDPCDCSGNEYFDHYEGDCGGGGGFIGGFGYGFGDYGNWYSGGQIGGGGSGNGGSNSGTTPPGWLAVDAISNPTLAALANSINQILETGDSYVFDNAIPTNNALTFNSVAEFKTFLNSNVTNTSFDLTTPSIVSPSGDEKTENAKVVLITFPAKGGVDIDVKLEKDATSNKWTVSNVTSSDYGYTFAWSWEHKDYTKSTSGNEITVIVKGYVKYNVFLEGIGTLYKSERKYQIKIDATTGKITSISQI